MNRGNRVYFNQENGVIIHQTLEQSGNISPHPTIIKIDYMDIPFGLIDYKVNYIESIDVSTQQPIIKSFPIQETEEQKHIRELEDALLIQAENEVGGIL